MENADTMLMTQMPAINAKHCHMCKRDWFNEPPEEVMVVDQENDSTCDGDTTDTENDTRSGADEVPPPPDDLLLTETADDSFESHAMPPRDVSPELECAQL